MSQGTIGWSPRKTRKRDDRMEVFDSLPPAIRAAYREAAFDWAVMSVPRYLLKGVAEREIVADVRRGDAEKIAADRTRVWGLSKTEAGLAELGLD